jgi:hypothetical protein
MKSMKKLTEKLSALGSAIEARMTQLQDTSFFARIQSPKVTLVLLVTTLILGVVCFILASRPPEEVVKVETRVEYKDRIVERVVEKEVVKWKERLVTEVRPDGTTVKTEEREGSKVVDVQKLAERVVTVREIQKVERKVPVEVLRRYAVGVAVGLDKSLNRIYTVDGAIRLGNLPLFITASGSSGLQGSLGLRLEF